MIALRSLKPQAPARVTWEQDVAETLSTLWGCDYGDASGFMDAHAVEVDELYAGRASAAGAASTLANMD